jgi:hypothetical protein
VTGEDMIVLKTGKIIYGIGKQQTKPGDIPCFGIWLQLFNFSSQICAIHKHCSLLAWLKDS